MLRKVLVIDACSGRALQMIIARTPKDFRPATQGREVERITELPIPSTRSDFIARKRKRDRRFVPQSCSLVVEMVVMEIRSTEYIDLLID